MTWLMMAIEGPFLAAVIARMGESAVNLAAYGIAYAFGLITEAPVIMLLSASTRLARTRADYLRLRVFSILLCGAVTSPDPDAAAAAPAHYLVTYVRSEGSVRERDARMAKLTAAVVASSRKASFSLGTPTLSVKGRITAPVISGLK